MIDAPPGRSSRSRRDGAKSAVQRNAASEAIAVYSGIEKLWDYANGAEAAGGRVCLRLRSGVWARWSGWVKSIQSDTTVTNHEQRILDGDDVLQWVLIHDN